MPTNTNALNIDEPDPTSDNKDPHNKGDGYNSMDLDKACDSDYAAVYNTDFDTRQDYAAGYRNCHCNSLNNCCPATIVSNNDNGNKTSNKSLEWDNNNKYHNSNY